MADSADISGWLDGLHRGDSDAVDALLPALYGELRKIAASLLRTAA